MTGLPPRYFHWGAFCVPCPLESAATAGRVLIGSTESERIESDEGTWSVAPECDGGILANPCVGGWEALGNGRKEVGRL